MMYVNALLLAIPFSIEAVPFSLSNLVNYVLWVILLLTSLHCPLWLDQRSPHASLSTSHKKIKPCGGVPARFFHIWFHLQCNVGDCVVYLWRWFVTLRQKRVALFSFPLGSISDYFPGEFTGIYCVNNDISGKGFFQGECMTSVCFFFFFLMRYLPPVQCLSLSSAKSARNSNERF